MKLQGLALIAITLLLPLIWLPGLAGPGEQGALFSQYIGLVALYAMAIAFVIATRWPGVEAIFGPMDQSYRVHKWLGLQICMKKPGRTRRPGQCFSSQARKGGISL